MLSSLMSSLVKSMSHIVSFDRGLHKESVFVDLVLQFYLVFKIRFEAVSSLITHKENINILVHPKMFTFI